jgi:hypothetical protein
MKQSLVLLVAIAILGLGVEPGFAQTRVFVSGSGSDANPCSLGAPCRSFQQAHNTVLAGGEIVALDAAGYGPLNISKAVTVTAIGIEASITSNSATGAAISISAGPSDTVTIRGLTIIAGTLANDGVDVNSAKSVTITDTSITGFPVQGVNITPSASLDVELSGVTANNNTHHGLQLFPSGSGAVTALVTQSSFNGNGLDGVFVTGVNSTGTIKATLSLTTAANGGAGISVDTGAAKSVPVVMVTQCKLANNNFGLFAQDGVKVLVDRSQISGNLQKGWTAITGAVVNSYTDNQVNGNGTDGLNGVTQITSE